MQPQPQRNRFLPHLTPLRLRRLQVRLTLEGLAREADIPFSTLARAERGEKSLPVDQQSRVERALARLEREQGPGAA